MGVFVCVTKARKQYAQKYWGTKALGVISVVSKLFLTLSNVSEYLVVHP